MKIPFMFILFIILQCNCSNSKFQREPNLETLQFNVNRVNEDVMNDLSPITTFIYEQTDKLLFRDSIHLQYKNGRWEPDKKFSLNENDFYVFAVYPSRKLVDNQIQLYTDDNIDYYISNSDKLKIISREDPFVEINMEPAFSKVCFQLSTSDTSKEYRLTKIYLRGINTSFARSMDIRYYRYGELWTGSMTTTLEFQCDYILPNTFTSDDALTYFFRL